MGKPVEFSNMADLKARIVEGCRAKQPANGLAALRYALRRLDHNQNGFIEPVEFKYALREFGIPISEEETAMVLKNFDLNRDGKLSANELFHCLREDSWNPRRQAVVEAAYNHLDVKGG